MGPGDSLSATEIAGVAQRLWLPRAIERVSYSLFNRHLRGCPGDSLSHSHCGCLEDSLAIPGRYVSRDEQRTTWGKRVMVLLCGEIPYR